MMYKEAVSYTHLDVYKRQLYNMLNRTLIPTYFSRFCAGGVMVGIPIGILFIIMQKFYVEGITGGSVKG